jgi:hypothetical protein
MAGEYSRELSAKLSRAHRQQAQLGFRQGGKLIYGFRRLLVDPARNPRQVLSGGERKAISSDKVVVISGPAEELAVIRRIFRLYLRNQLPVTDIVKRLAKAGVTASGGKPLGVSTVRNILSSELCVGRMTYNLTTRRLEGRSLKNPERLWTRFASFPPIISVKQFRKAQERLAQSTNRRWDKEATIESLRSLLARKGRLTQVSINQAEDTPSVMTVVKHFGSLRAAYAAIGYKPPPRPSADGKYWSNEEILEGLRKLYKAHGYISNRVIDSCPGLPSYDYTRRRFGSISETMRQAGLPVLSDSQIQRRAWEQRKATGCDEYYRGIHWTEANLLRALRQLQKQYGFVSINLLNRNVGTPSANYFVKRFGSLTKARILAKLSDQTHSQIMVSAWKRKKGDNTISATAGATPQAVASIGRYFAWLNAAGRTGRCGISPSDRRRYQSAFMGHCGEPFWFAFRRLQIGWPDPFGWKPRSVWFATPKMRHGLRTGR